VDNVRLEWLRQVRIVLIALILLQLKERFDSFKFLRHVVRWSRLSLQICGVVLRGRGFDHLVETRCLVLNISLLFFCFLFGRSLFSRFL
jgi:hypothetical protein